MSAIRNLTKCAIQAKGSKKINWHPGHMFSGMKAMIGKLNTVDCVIEVHDARIPLIGRNSEFRQHLGRVKPHILVLNKSDLADLSNWTKIKSRLLENGDENVLLTDLSGSQFSYANKGYDRLLNKAIELVNRSHRFNRASIDHFKIMIVGIPNVGKSTLINRLRQYHLGRSGNATKTGNEAGVTKAVEFMIKICARPLIYSLDTPGVLEPSTTRDHHAAMKLALCSTISDRILEPAQLVDYLIEYLNNSGNLTYQYTLGLDRPLKDSRDLVQLIAAGKYSDQQLNIKIKNDNIFSDDSHRICWKFVKLFREGKFGKIMFE